jgi:hypothetical protein
MSCHLIDPDACMNDLEQVSNQFHVLLVSNVGTVRWLYLVMYVLKVIIVHRGVGMLHHVQMVITVPFIHRSQHHVHLAHSLLQ